MSTRPLVKTNLEKIDPRQFIGVHRNERGTRWDIVVHSLDRDEVVGSKPTALDAIQRVEHLITITRAWLPDDEGLSRLERAIVVWATGWSLQFVDRIRTRAAQHAENCGVDLAAQTIADTIEHLEKGCWPLCEWPPHPYPPISETQLYNLTTYHRAGLESKDIDNAARVLTYQFCSGPGLSHGPTHPAGRPLGEPPPSGRSFSRSEAVLSWHETKRQQEASRARSEAGDRLEVEVERLLRARCIAAFTDAWTKEEVA